MKKILTTAFFSVAVMHFAQTADPNNFAMTINSGQTVTLDATKTYKLTGAVIVNNGGQLIIPAGTKIVSTGGTSSYVAVAQGGKIFSNGTPTNPVIFTSGAAAPEKGDWGGIVICGRAPINIGKTGTSEVATLPYGGEDPADNSGSITYTQINWSGARFSETKEYNGLSLFGVGNGTTINGVAVINGADDGIEFFGGTVNVSNIVSINNDDDAFDWTEGWSGTATNIYGRRIDGAVGNRGMEADNNANNYSAGPISNPTIKNATFIGYKTTDNEGAGTNLFRVGSRGTLDNLVLAGWADAITLQHDETLNWFNGKGKFTNVRFEDVTRKAITKSTAGATANAAIGTFTENPNATGAGAGLFLPDWAKGWSGYDEFLATTETVKNAAIKVVADAAELRIVSDEKISQIDVIEMSGRSVLKSNRTTANISTLKPGTYIVTARAADGELFVSKFIKK